MNRQHALLEVPTDPQSASIRNDDEKGQEPTRSKWPVE
jgi:hypothetical protein